MVASFFGSVRPFPAVMHPKPIGRILEDVPLIGGIDIGHDCFNRSRLAIFPGGDFRAKFQFPLAEASPAA